MLDRIWSDVRLGARTLRRSTTFTVGATLILALGIGVSTGVFTAVDALLLRRLPYPDADRVMTVAMLPSGASVSKQTLVRLRERQRSFTGLAAWSRWGFRRRTPAATDFIQGAVATADFFSVLGTRAHVGRLFEPGDDTPGRGGRVVLSYEYWQRSFGGRSDVVGTTMILNDATHTIVGVLPPGAGYPSSGVDLWSATPMDRADSFDYASAGYLLPIARLRSAVSPDAAAADMRAIARALQAEFPDDYAERYGDGASVTPLRESMLGSTRTVLLVSLGAVGLLLLVTCANVGNLVIARASTRRHDGALRRALGASNRDIQRIVVVEVLMLGVLGGVGGIAVAGGVTVLIESLLPADLVNASTLGLDARAFAFATLLSVLVGVLCAALPTVRASRSVDAELLRSGAHRAGDPTGHRTMGLLLVVEAATAVVLAIGAGLMLQTVWSLTHTPLGFSHEGVVAFTVILPPDASDANRQSVMYDALHGELVRLPGVTSVGAASPLPFSGSIQTPAVTIEGVPAARGEQSTVDWRRVSASYFSALRIPLVRGRVFTAADRQGTLGVAIVNETFARQHFPGRDPLGQRVRTVLDGSEWATIVGVVGDTKTTSVTADASPQMYRPLAQRPAAFTSFVVRVSGDPIAILRSISTAVHRVNRNAVTLQARLMEHMLGESFAQRRTVTTILTVFATIALLLGGSGVAALSAYRVAQRRRDIAIRMALGATPASVAGSVVGDTLVLTVAGVGIGSVIALATTRFLASQLYGLGTSDPFTYAIVAALMCAGTVLATWAPARRAAHVDPASALRDV